ncbi:MAG: hypothetical protein HY472_00705 [Candidatus Sungbacteria bacterium]|nr:hypothetical protein [Candidatus Sungbacteria bacterium]
MNPFRIFQERFNGAYHRTRYLWPVWFYLLNRRSRRLLAHGAPLAIDRISHRILWDLRRDGIAFAHISEFPGGGEAFDRMRAWVQERMSDPTIREGIAAHADMLSGRVEAGKKSGGKYFKDFLLNLWHRGEPGSAGYDSENPFLKFLTNDYIISAAAAYLGLMPRLNSISLYSTLVVPPDSPAHLSQRWHRDPEDKKIIKVFLYMTDVDEIGAGPFTYVLQSHLGGKWRDIFPQRPPVGRYPLPGAVEWHIPPDDVKTCLAPKGTIIFCDTSGLHKGGFSTTKNRIMFTVCYCSDASLQPINYQRPSEEEIASLPRLAKFVLRR